MNKADVINQFNELMKKVKLDELISQCKNLNQRTLVIIAALALPVILLAVAVHSGASKTNAGQHAAVKSNGHHPTLEQARTTVRQRLAVLKKMTPEQWPQERKTNRWAPPTLEQAIINNTNRLAQLNAMTEEQYEAQFGQNAPNANTNPGLTPQQRSSLDIIPAPPKSQSPSLPSTSR